MQDAVSLFRLARLLLRGWKIVAFAVLAAFSLGFFYTYQATPSYQAQATLKINDRESGSAEFWKAFESFSKTGTLLTELEVLKSKYLIEKALQKLDFELEIYQEIRGKWRELYHRSPFIVEYEVVDPASMDQKFVLDYQEDSLFVRLENQSDATIKKEIKIGDSVLWKGLRFCIKKNPQSDHTYAPGRYAFEVNSMSKLLEKYANKQLLVKLLDKEVSIVKIYFAHKVPLKAQKFTNALAETYIQDFIDSKADAARKALSFIDQELQTASHELSVAERSIEQYKSAQGAVSPQQGLEQDGKRIQALETQANSIEQEISQLNQLQLYLSGSDQAFPALDFGSISDPLFQENIRKIQQKSSEQSKLLEKYTPKHPNVIALNEQIEELGEQLKLGLANTHLSRQQQLLEVQASIQEVYAEMKQYPTMERDLVVLNRKFESSQRKFEFLQQKRDEAAIGAAATIAFHRILDRANLPKHPISNQKMVIMFIAGFLGFLIAVGLLIVKQYFKGSGVIFEDLKEIPEVHIVGKWPKKTSKSELSPDIFDLCSAIQLAGGNQVIGITALREKENSAQTAWTLANAFAQLGQQTLLVDANLYHPSLHEMTETLPSPGMSNWISGELDVDVVIQMTAHPQLDLLPAGSPIDPVASIFLHPELSQKWQRMLTTYDKVIVNCPAYAGRREITPLLQITDLCLWVVKEGTSSLLTIKQQIHALQAVGVSSIGTIWSAK